jgi:hypothetical protein
VRVPPGNTAGGWTYRSCARFLLCSERRHVVTPRLPLPLLPRKLLPLTQ